jgi:HEPN domain-containing protein
MKDHDIAEWLIVADKDTHSAILLNDGNELENALYHCTQAVEKYLKAYLIANNIMINYNHHISETLKRCINHDNVFCEIISECNEMTTIVNKLRYPKRMDVTKNHINDAFCLIEKVKNLKPIQNLYNDLINKYGENWRNVLFKKVVNMETDV